MLGKVRDVLEGRKCQGEKREGQRGRGNIRRRKKGRRGEWGTWVERRER